MTYANTRSGNMQSIPEANRVALAERINSLGLSWTASSYLDAPKELSLSQVGSAGNVFNDGSS